MKRRLLLPAVAAILALTIPPALAEDCETLDYVTEAREVPDLKAAVSNSMGFGGHNVVVAFASVE